MPDDIDAWTENLQGGKRRPTPRSAVAHDERHRGEHLLSPDVNHEGGVAQTRKTGKRKKNNSSRPMSGRTRRRQNAPAVRARPHGGGNATRLLPPKTNPPSKSSLAVKLFRHTRAPCVEYYNDQPISGTRERNKFKKRKKRLSSRAHDVSGANSYTRTTVRHATRAALAFLSENNKSAKLNTVSVALCPINSVVCRTKTKYFPAK